MDIYSKNSNRRINLIKPLLLFGLICSIFLSFYFAKSLPPQPLVSPLARPSLKNTIEEAMWDTKASYGVVVKNLKTGESYSLNEHQGFDAGSLYKLWIMATAMNQIQAGILKEDQVLSEEVESLNMTFGLSPDAAELSEGVITLNVSNALKQMITISHNYAALLLSKKVKLSSVSEFLKTHNLNESMIGEPAPRTSAADIARFFEKLYRGELASVESTQKMIELLKNQQLNNKLPKYLPKGTVVAHKTGEIGYFSHDSGIVYSAGDYIIVVLSESSSPRAAEERIGKLSKAIYAYFNSGNN